MLHVLNLRFAFLAATVSAAGAAPALAATSASTSTRPLSTPNPSSTVSGALRSGVQLPSEMNLYFITVPAATVVTYVQPLSPFVIGRAPACQFVKSPAMTTSCARDFRKRMLLLLFHRSTFSQIHQQMPLCRVP